MAHLMQTPPGPKTTIDGKEYLYFSGTGYLGLHGDARVIDAAVRATQQFGLGSGTARSGYGTMPPLEDVERQAATFFGTEDAFYFPSGYLGSSVLIKALAGTFDLIIHDEAVHYSSRDAAILAGKPIVTFKSRDPEHRNFEHLAEILQNQVPPDSRPLLLVDGVFPVQGTISPLGLYIEQLQKYPDAALVVDDAHGLGVLGEQGRGSYEHAGIPSSEINTGRPSIQGLRLFACGTMSKAFGGYGGIVFGTREFVTHAKHNTPYLSGLSTLPPGVAAATAEALRIVGDDPGILKRLRENVFQARTGLRRLGLPVEQGPVHESPVHESPVHESPVPVICLELGTADEMRQIQVTLQQRGILIAYQPTYSDLGPEGALRIAVCAAHTPEMIDTLVDAFRAVFDRMVH